MGNHPAVEFTKNRLNRRGFFPAPLLLDGGRGICAALLRTVPENARAAGLCELYLYTVHAGLYEKFGWTFLEQVDTFRPDSPKQRLYRLQL